MYVEKTKNLLSFADVPKEMAKERKKGSSGGRVSVGRNDLKCWREGSADDGIFLFPSSSVRKGAIWTILSMTIPMRTCR